MRDKPLIAAPRELDRPLVLSHSRGLQSKGFSSQNKRSAVSLEILESSGVRIQNAFFVIASGACTAWQSIKKWILVWIATRINPLAMTEKKRILGKQASAVSLENEQRPKSPHTTQAEGFLMRKLCFTSAGEGILLGVNEQARAK